MSLATWTVVTIELSILTLLSHYITAESVEKWWCKGGGKSDLEVEKNEKEGNEGNEGNEGSGPYGQ